MNTKIKKLEDRKIAILGLGIENQALLKWLLNHKAKDITLCDKNSISNFPASPAGRQFPNKSQISNLKFQMGKNYLDNLEKFDIIFRTPGLPVMTPEIQKAKKSGVEISSQMKLFMDLCPAKIIGVTGTKGKGTTSTLIAEILTVSISDISKKDVRSFHGAQVSGKRLRPTFFEISEDSNVFLAGNIGKAPIDFLDEIKKNDWVVLEMSSFQLQDMAESPHIAVVLNITSDHLDYHKDTKEYIEAKTNIVRFQKKSDYAVINADYLTSFRFAAISPSDNDYYFSTKKSVDQGAYVEWEPKAGANWGKIILRTPEKDIEIAKTYDIKLRGRHNLENICAAVTASCLAGANIQAIKKVIQNFRGLPLRIELVFEDGKTKYYNDSASTNPDTTIAAIASFAEPIILIAGGSSKGADYTRLGEELAKSSAKTVILMGKTADRIKDSIKKQDTRNKIQTIIVKNLQDAIKMSKKEAKTGDVVLFSPASASFDMFRDYKDRGDQFNKLVKS
jgi:UDP-N-acetylmuramoylalanine--D-glutamate ligase